MLQLRNITKIYKNGKNDVVALKNVSIDFPQTGMVFIVGKSGAGKTTLLNILGGLDKKNEGEIIIDGKSTNDFTSKDFDAYRNHQIGFIFQEFNLIDDLTVKDNIAIALKIQAKGHDATTIDEALKLVNLEGLGYRTPRELSGGQKQRISIARALVKNPNIILADEPTGAIDSKTGYELMNSLKALSNDKLVVIVTHDNEMAYNFADEIIKINDGEIVDHLKIRKDYIKPDYEFINKNVIKINSGGKLDNPDIINDNIDMSKTNYVCLTNQPENITIAHPELYDEIFKVEDISNKYESIQGLQEIENKKDQKDDKKHERIRFVECLKMALKQFLISKGKILFVILFLVLAISVTSFTYSVYTIDSSNVIADTLKKNNMKLGIMGKYENGNYVILDDNDAKNLKEKYDNNFAIAKQINLRYTPSTKNTNNAFEMRYFRGIVECDNVIDLNLNIIAGTGTFNEESLENHHIIISDYAAYELCRTGYLGYDNTGNYGIILPTSNEQLINSKIIINNYSYTIIGIFDTNFEDYLSLLVSETYVSDSSEQSSSLNALKYYYFARIFGPKGFYAKYIDENKIYENMSVFSTLFSGLEIHEYDNENDELLDDYSILNVEYNGFSSFTSWQDYLDNKRDTQNYEVVYGKIPEGGLKDNEVILSMDFFRSKNIYYPKQLEAVIETINNNTKFRKMKDANTVDTTIYQDTINVVAVVDMDNIDTLQEGEKDYNQIAIYLSKEKKDELNKSLYGYDQLLFTLNGSRRQYKNTIKKMVKEKYNVYNIDGSSTLDHNALEDTKTALLAVSAILLLFAFLIMMNYVSSNIKSRKKEMGILRATGAKGKDIIKIFMVEEGMIASIIAILSIIIVGYAVSMVNTQFGNANLKINAIVFDFDIILITILSTALFFTITTLIPIINMASISPIDAMKKK